jgi:hypothetical protein
MRVNDVLLMTALVSLMLIVANILFAEGVANPDWSLEQIRASHNVYNKENDLPNKPVFDVDDPLKLLLLVEQGGHHATLFDSGKLESRHRFESEYPLHGGVRYSPTRRFVYSSSPDGWISKYDIYNLKLIAEVRAGINTRTLALSADGRYIMVANYTPHALVLLDARDLSPIKLYDVKDTKGNSSRVSAVYTAPPSSSFIAALKDIPELWEISYAANPPPGFGVWIHDYRTDSGENTTPEPFSVRKISVSNYLDDLFFDNEYVSVIGVSAEGKGQVADLDVGRIIIDDLGLPGIPHPGSGTSWQYNGRTLFAIPNYKQGIVSIIDMETWKTIRQVETLGPGSVMCSHKNSPYVWVDVFSGINKGVVHVIDKRTLEIIKTLRPVPGKTVAAIEFTRDSRHVLVSLSETESGLIVYDANTLNEVKRIQMNKLPGK